MGQVSGHLNLSSRIHRSKSIYNSKFVHFILKRNFEIKLEDLLENISVYSGLDPVCYKENELYVLFFTKFYPFRIKGFTKHQLKEQFHRATKMFQFLLQEYQGTVLEIMN